MLCVGGSNCDDVFFREEEVTMKFEIGNRPAPGSFKILLRTTQKSGAGDFCVEKK